MPKFKIRDLMVALRPGLPTPERPKALDCLDITCVDPSDVCDDGSVVCDDGSIVCDDGSIECGDSCDDGESCDIGTCGCTDNTCLACTGTCGPCTQGCTVCTAVTCGPCSLGCTRTCAGCSNRFTCAGCSILVSCRGNSLVVCQAPSAGCGVTCRLATCAGVTLKTAPPIIGKMAPGELARLKKQLRQTMQQVEQREKVLAKAAEQRAVAPQTVEQVDALEKKLSEALEELRQRRAELQKSAKEKKQ